MRYFHPTARSIRSTCLCLMALVPAAPALGQGWVQAYSYDFEAVQVGSFSGIDGWVSGWDEDPWTTRACPGCSAATQTGTGWWSTTSRGAPCRTWWDG